MGPTTLAILVLLPLSAFEATAALPAAAIQLTRALIAAGRLVDLTAPDPAARLRPTFRLPEVRRGDRLAIVGDSGCGKTTTQLAMAADHESPLTAGFFPEDAHLFDTTVRDNLLDARGDATDPELRATLEAVGLLAWLENLPDGLATMLTGGPRRSPRGSDGVCCSPARSSANCRSYCSTNRPNTSTPPMPTSSCANCWRPTDSSRPPAPSSSPRITCRGGVTCPVLYPRQT